MSEPIVIELQRLATEKGQDVDDLLRKALIVATKLKIAEFRKWIESELHGYQDPKGVPSYRIVKTKLQAFNDVRGQLIPYHLPPKIAELLRNAPINQPIATLVQLASSENTSLQITLAPAEERILLEIQGDYPMQPIKTVASTEVTKIIDAVRTTILEWALRLEEAGIVGDGIRPLPVKSCAKWQELFRARRFTT